MPDETNNPGSASLSYYVASFKGRTVAIKRNPDYGATIKLMQRSIAKLRSTDPQDIIISTSLADYGNAIVQISEDIWPDVVGNVKVVEIGLEELTGSEVSAPRPTGTTSVTFTPRNTDPETNSVAVMTADQTTVSSVLNQTSDQVVGLSTAAFSPPALTLRTSVQTLITLDGLTMPNTVKGVKEHIQEYYSIPTALQQIELKSVRLNDSLNLGSSAVGEGVFMDLALKTRKSAIYILPNYSSYTNSSYRTHYTLQPLHNCVVRFSVNRKWELAALWPHACDQLTGFMQSTSWTINVPTEQTLSHPGVDSKIPWIYWDGSPSAESSPLEGGAPEDPPPQLDYSIEFYRSTQVMRPDNSVAVPFDSVETYISGVLPTSMRSRGHILRPLLTELSSKHCSHLAIRFMPQDEYKKAAIISVSGHPSAQVNHAVLLYKRLDDKTALIWDSIPPFRDGQLPVWKDVVNPADIVQQEGRSQILVVDFTFFEVY